MHIGSRQCMVIHPFRYFQVSTMNVNGVIHHTFIQSVGGDYLSLATRKMGGIGLGGKVTGIVFPF